MKEDKKHTSIRLDKNTLEKLDYLLDEDKTITDYAKTKPRTRSDIIADAINEKYERSKEGKQNATDIKSMEDKIAKIEATNSKIAKRIDDIFFYSLKNDLTHKIVLSSPYIIPEDIFSREEAVDFVKEEKDWDQIVFEAMFDENETNKI